MDEALSSQRNPPALKINPLTDRDTRNTQMNEQESIYRICAGIVKLFRNPLSHQGQLQSHYAQTRFKDKKTVLKIIAFFSYICERIDRGELHL